MLMHNRKIISPPTLGLFGWLVASQPAVLFSHTNSASVTSHQPANSIFLSQRISLSYQPPASRTRPLYGSVCRIGKGYLISKLRLNKVLRIMKIFFQKFDN
jgi:hypothetical protein